MTYFTADLQVEILLVTLRKSESKQVFLTHFKKACITLFIDFYLLNPPSSAQIIIHSLTCIICSLWLRGLNILFWTVYSLSPQLWDSDLHLLLISNWDHGSKHTFGLLWQASFQWLETVNYMQKRRTPEKGFSVNLGTLQELVKLNLKKIQKKPHHHRTFWLTENCCTWESITQN